MHHPCSAARAAPWRQAPQAIPPTTRDAYIRGWPHIAVGLDVSVATVSRMPSNADRLPTDWLATDDPTCDPWLLTGDTPDAVGWRDACIGNGLIGQRISPHGDGQGYGSRSCSFRHGLWGGARENPKRPQGLIELPVWAGLQLADREHDLRRRPVTRHDYRQTLDLRTATVTTSYTEQGSLAPFSVERRVWLARNVPQLGVIEATIDLPEGGALELEEVLDATDWPDLAASDTDHDGDDLVLQATSGRFDHRVVVRSRILVDADQAAEPAEVTDHAVSARRRIVVWGQPGARIRVTKLVAITTDLDDNDPDALGRALLDQHAADIASLRAGHEEAWAACWASRIEVPHHRLQLLLNVSWYHHLIALAPGVHSHGPTGLTGNGWDGLVFWDTDTWTLPVYAMLAPELAKACVAYRHATIDGARANATACGEVGARWPWMSGQDGRESCSMHVFQNERHIVSCVALAQWTYARCAGDETWLANEGRAVITASAEYWAGKATANDDGSWSINGVCGADEDAGIVDDNATTNAGAAWTLRLATKLAEAAGDTPPSAWTTIADGLRIPWDDEHDIPKQMASWTHGQIIKQADTSLMVYPWQYPFDDATKQRLVDYYRTHYPEHPIMMGRAIDAVVDCELGRSEQAWSELSALCAHCTLPFLTATEDPVNERLPFVTGYGGLLQLALAGFAGIRVTDGGLTITPQLPAAVPWLTVHGLHDGGQRRTVTVHADGRVVDA